MKWLRVWMEQESHEGGEILSGIVVGVADETWLMVRQDDGTIQTFNHEFIIQSKWVSDPEKKVSMPRVKR